MSHPLDHEDIRNLKADELFGVIDDWVNCHASSSCPKAFSNALNFTHRTLQESFISIMFGALVQYGRDHQEPYSFDARNEDAVMLCRKLAQLVDEQELSTYLRYI